VGVINPQSGIMEVISRITAIEETWWRGVPRLQFSLADDIPPLITREALGKTHPVTHNMEFFSIKPEEISEHMLINLSLKSDGFILRDNHFGENHINGIKLKGSNGIIQGNLFDRHTSIGISICMRLTWQEAFAPRNVTIRDNTFRGCSGIEATIDYPGGRFSHGPCYIDGIELENNRFEEVEGFGLMLANVRSMKITGNEFTAEKPVKFSIHPGCLSIVWRDNKLNGKLLEKENP
jgi:hypothetical protein